MSETVTVRGFAGTDIRKITTGSSPVEWCMSRDPSVL